MFTNVLNFSYLIWSIIACDLCWSAFHFIRSPLWSYIS